MLVLYFSSKAEGFVREPTIKDATFGLGSLLDTMVYVGLGIGMAGLLLDVMVRNKQDGFKKALLYLAAFGVYLIIKAVFLKSNPI
ncbi:MAG: hypothetical protein HS119_11220 [Flavobacteriales bacterium]|nr:hypothetical protein [Flavobacteriales bacterium]